MAIDPDAFAERVTTEALESISPTLGAEFSEAGYREFAKVASDYLSDLLDATYRETRRQRADRVTPDYVRSAAAQVASPSRRVWITFVGTFGGILLGSGIALIPTWVGAEKVDPGQAILVVVLGLLGAAMMVGAFVSELNRR